MGSPTRTRARKTAQAAKKAETPEPDPFTEEEAALAASQEQAEYLQAQNIYLQGRVATLRANLNRLSEENARLKKNTTEGA